MHLKTFNNPNLREFPGPHHFPRIMTLVLSYAYHCCAFLPQEDEEEQELKMIDSVYPIDHNGTVDPSLWNDTDFWAKYIGKIYANKTI